MALFGIANITGVSITATEYTVVYSWWATDGTNIAESNNNAVSISFSETHPDRVVRQAIAAQISAQVGHGTVLIDPDDVYIPFAVRS